MTRAYLAFTETGLALAKRLSAALPGSVARCGRDGVSLAEWTSAQFVQSDALIFVGAAGIAVRAIAPHCKSKTTDPAVVVVDECGRFAVPILSGHLGGANDLARAIAFVFTHAEELEVDTSGYSLWGGSAGARMAAWLGSYGTASFGEQAYPQPGAVIMQYTGLGEVYGNEPPTYACVGDRDYIADERVMRWRIETIRSQGTPAEIEVFPGLAHGFGLGTGTSAEGWLDHAVAFWEENT